MPPKRPDLLEYLFSAVRTEKARRLTAAPEDKIEVVLATMQPHQQQVHQNIRSGTRWV